MRSAIGLANAAYRVDEVPIGAVVVLNGQIIGQGYNRTIIDCDPSAHAEVIALRSASTCQKNHRLPGASLYVTIEPCAMCAGAIIQARIDTVVFGAFDPKSGAAGSVFDILNEPALNHQSTVISGILEQECAEILKDYFRAKRDTKQE